MGNTNIISYHKIQAPSFPNFLPFTFNNNQAVIKKVKRFNYSINTSPKGSPKPLRNPFIITAAIILVTKYVFAPIYNFILKPENKGGAGYDKLIKSPPTITKIKIKTQTDEDDCIAKFIEVANKNIESDGILKKSLGKIYSLYDLCGMYSAETSESRQFWTNISNDPNIDYKCYNEIRNLLKNICSKGHN